MVLIRVDANEIIGTGHIMRCLSIAHAFIDRGEKVLFVTADHRGEELISSQGFDLICLDSDWKHMENEKLDHVIDNYKPDLLLLDSYYVTDNYINSLHELVKIAYIDDLNKNTWDVDYLINYNIFGTVVNYSGYSNSGTKLLLGPQYAPLRDEFKCCSKHTITTISDVLVSAGGADPEHITERIISNVCSRMKGIKFHFIVGALNPRIEEIKYLDEINENTVLHINEKRLSNLMKSCDLAISASGSTLYELCATGTPTITYTLADNQLMAAEEFNKQGIMLNAGDCRGDDRFIERLEGILKILVCDEALRRRLSGRMQGVVDGNGAERIANILI